MNRYQAKLEPPVRVADSGSEPRRSRAPRANRLSRSFRLTQAVPAAELDSPRNQRVPEFKTPIRTRSKPAPVLCAESPLSDSDFQQDIIWDATSPLARRAGKRGKKQTPGVVNISQIVSRIAPKSGRPKAAEPGLQQWIGDSATIPCTPDLQTPRAKRKSPRVSVEDLLRLAKRFDHICHPQDQDLDPQNLDLQDLDPQDLDPQHLDLQDLDPQRLDLLPQYIHQSEPSASLPEDHQLDVDPAPGTDLDLDHQLDVDPAPGTDLDLDHQLDVDPASGTDLDLDQDHQLDVDPAPGTDLNQNHQLEDLDFLFDGPTQNFSWDLSQTPSGPSEDCRRPPESGGFGSVRGAFEDDWENDDLLKDLLVLDMTQNPQNLLPPKLCSTQKPSGPTEPSGPGRLPGWVGPRLQENLRPRATFKLESRPGVSGFRNQTDWLGDPGSEDSQGTGSPAGTGLHRTGPTCHSNSLRPEPQKSQVDLRTSSETFRPDLVDFLDLDFLFSSDPVWDDPAEDELLCRVCEDLENQNLNVIKQTPVPSNQRAALQPTHRTCMNQVQTGPGGSSVPGGAAGRMDHPVTMATSKGKCSAAEIQLKKQRALQRRYQRLQAQQNRLGTS